MKRPFLLCLSWLLAVGPAFAQEPPAVGGTWTLNEALSDDLEAKVLEAVGGGKTVGQGGLEGPRVELRRAILALLPALARVEIEQSPTEIKYADADDNVRIFYFGREHVRESRGGRKLRSSVEWKGPQLLITEVAEDGRLTELLTPVPGRNQLIHVVRLEDKRLKSPLELRLVYDAAPSGPAQKD
jgi:hypothetical protein